MSDAVAVLGAGAWGTALAVQAARAGAAVCLWARDPAVAAAIQTDRRNPRLPGITLPQGVTVTNDPHRAIDGAAHLLLAVPTQHLRAVARLLPVAGQALVVCAKGVEIGSGLFPVEILTEMYPSSPMAVLSGPTFAMELAAGQPTAAVLAAKDRSLRGLLMARLGTGAFRLYGNDDLIGVQIGGAAKNVIAIGAGVVIGAGFGENARAALVTRSLTELSRLTVALGGKPDTVTGLSGLGDLLLTCTGERSRNFSLGVALGRGASLQDILAERTAVTEGVTTASALLGRAGSVEMPICRAVAALLQGTTTPRQALETLLARQMRDE